MPAFDSAFDSSAFDAGAAGPQTGSLSIPIAIFVGVSGNDSAPISIAVGVASQTTTPLSLTVAPAALANGTLSAADSNAGSAGLWAARVLLDNVDISAQCIGAITIEAEENAARIADLTIRPEPGSVLALPSWAGKALSIDLCALIAGVAMYPVRLFTGVIDRPDYDIKARVIKLTCTDGRDALCNALSNAEIDALVGGHWSPAVFSNTAAGLNYAKDRLSTTPAALDLSVNRAVRVTSLAASSIDWSFDDDNVIESSVNAAPVDLSSLINHVDIAFNYRFPRMKAEAHPIGYQYVTAGSFAQFIIDGKWFLTRDAVAAAISSAGGSPLLPIVYTQLPDDVVEITYPGGATAYWTPNPDVDDTLCMGFACDVTFDYSNLQEEAHQIAVQCPAGVLASGKRASTLSGALEGKAEDTSAAEIHAWLYKSDLKTDIPPEVATPLAGFTTDKTITLTADTNRAAADAAMETLIAIAKTQIMASHRQNAVSFSTVLNPLLDVIDTAEINADGVHAVGKIKRVVHRMDADSGEATSSIELAVSALSGIGTIHPDSPVLAPAGTTDGARALASTPYIVFNAGANEDHAITIEFPAVAAGERDNTITTIATAFDAPIIENLFEVTT